MTTAAFRIRTLTGHLTAREKSAVSHMLEHGMTSAQTARLTFALDVDDHGAQRVTVSRVETDDWGRKVNRRDRATFEAVAR